MTITENSAPEVRQPSGRVADRVALVFGAGSSGPGWGNGKAAAFLYAHEGAKVIAVDLQKARAEETANIIRAHGGVSEALEADVTSGESVRETVEAASKMFGRIDILHNNVGITRMGSIVDVSEEQWHEVVDANLTGTFLTCKHVIPFMLAQKKGAIVNISSGASLRINQYPYVSYSVAKAGVNHLTRSIAVQYARQGIRANAVLPGLINTPMVYAQISGQYASIDAMVAARDAASPTGKMGRSWDIAYSALFLASDEAQYINGVCLSVDGGKSAQSS